MNNQRKKNVLAAVALQQGPGGINRQVRAVNRELSGYRPLIAPAFLNGQGQTGRTSLMYAAHTGDVARLNQLLAGHANPNLVDETGFTALMYAAAGGHVPCILALLQAGANPNLAAHLPEGQEAVFGVNNPALNGYTPIVFSALRGDAQAVQALQAAGASLVLPNGRTVIQAACLGNYEIVENDIGALRHVLQAGIPITPQDIEAAFHTNDDDNGGGSPFQYQFIRVLMQGLIHQVPDRDQRLAILVAANLPEGRDAVDILNNIGNPPGAAAQQMHERRRKSRRRKAKRMRRSRRSTFRK